MTALVGLAWRQLARRRLRLVVACAGVVFAVVLIVMQLGFHDALYESSVRFHRRLNTDLVVLNPDYLFLGVSRPFSRRRLYQITADPRVAEVASIQYELAPWKNPATGKGRNLMLVGINADEHPLQLPEASQARMGLGASKVVWFDRASRHEFGLAEERETEQIPVPVEVASRAVSVGGYFSIGPSFAVDGIVLTSQNNFLRLLRHRRSSQIDIGLIRLRPGTDLEQAKRQLAARLPADVEILTRTEFIDREQAHWRTNTPIGYVFTFGAIMGFIVGAVIVYQILFTSVADNLREFATLKAIGYADGSLFTVVWAQALMLAVLGFFPGLLLCHFLYGIAGSATQLPMALSLGIGTLVFILTVVMCCLSAGLALRKVWSADPAEVFA